MPGFHPRRGARTKCLLLPDLFFNERKRVHAYHTGFVSSSERSAILAGQPTLAVMYKINTTYSAIEESGRTRGLIRVHAHSINIQLSPDMLDPPIWHLSLDPPAPKQIDSAESRACCRSQQACGCEAVATVPDHTVNAYFVWPGAGSTGNRFG